MPPFWPIAAHFPTAVRGSVGIQPPCRPSWYDHSGASTVPAVELPICPPEAPVSNAGEKDRRAGVQKKNAHLPRPEEPILQRVHTRHRKRPNASYSRRIPRRRILPRRTVPAKRRRITDPPDEQPAVVITSAELPGNSHPKGRLRLIDARAPGGACHPRPHSARA